MRFFLVSILLFIITIIVAKKQRKFTDFFMAKVYVIGIWMIEIIASLIRHNFTLMNRNGVLSVIFMVFNPLIIIFVTVFIINVIKTKNDSNK